MKKGNKKKLTKLKLMTLGVRRRWIHDVLSMTPEEISSMWTTLQESLLTDSEDHRLYTVEKMNVMLSTIKFVYGDEIAQALMEQHARWEVEWTPAQVAA